MTSAPAADAPGADDAPPPTVTLDVWRLRPRDVVRAMVAIPAWGRRAPGFAKLLGTGGTRFTPTSPDLGRWVSLTVAAVPPAQPAWAHHAVDHFRARLVPLSARGRWGGRTPFVTASRPVGTAWRGEVLALTRARLRPTRIPTFWRAVPPVAVALQGTDGLHAAMAVGEAPIGYQGTLSLWRDPAAVATFARRDPAHRAVVSRTPAEHWYAEELFARFAVVERTGSLAVWADRPGRQDRSA